MSNREQQSVKNHPNMERAQARCQQVLAAAEECFLQRGFHSASMAEISRAAGMSAGHIYNYFESKEAIIAAIVAQHIDASLTAFDKLPETKHEVVQALQQIAHERTDEFASKQKAALMFDILAEAARSQKMAEVVHEFEMHARERMLQLCNAYADSVDALELAFRLDVLKTMFNGLALKVVSEPDYDKERAYQMICRVIGMLFVKPDGACS